MLKKFQSHKVVEAAKIVSTEPLKTPGAVALVFEDGSKQAMSPEWVEKHTPEAGGYFVRYADGYESFSPAEAFEGGYAPFDPAAPTPDDRIKELEHEVAARGQKIADLEQALEDTSERRYRPRVDAPTLTGPDEGGGGDELETFVRAHAGVPLRIVVEPRTNILRLANMDQTEQLVGAVHGNTFQPQR